MSFASRSLKQKLQNGRPLLGTFVFSTDAAMCELFAAAGFDFVIIDTEHAVNDVQSVQRHIWAARSAGIDSIVRLGPSSMQDVSRLLDAGAEGIMLPHLGLSADETTQAILSLRYWPDGGRPTCTGVRSAGFGITKFSEAAQRANDGVLAVGLIEDRETVDTLDKVLDETKVDWIMPGPADLATSLGVHGQLTHPKVQEAVDRVFDVARLKGIAAGMYVNEVDTIEKWRSKGAEFFVYSIDYKMLALHARTVGDAFKQKFS